jgi:hypothetical protein
MTLPLALAVRPKGALAEMCASGRVSHLLALTLTALHEMQTSSRTPYFDDLASQKPPYIPLRWSVAELEQLTGTSLLPPGVTAVDTANAVRTAYDEVVLPVVAELDAAYVPALTFDAFTRALAWVVSRGLQGRVAYQVERPTLPYLPADGPPSGGGPFLLPLVDLVNHSHLAAERCCTKLERSATQPETLEMCASRDVAIGDELLHSCACGKAHPTACRPRSSTHVSTRRADRSAACVSCVRVQTAPSEVLSSFGRMASLPPHRRPTC